MALIPLVQEKMGFDMQVYDWALTIQFYGWVLSIQFLG